MLPAAGRLRNSVEFGTVVRRGTRVRRGPLVVHALRGEVDASADSVSHDLVSHRSMTPGARAGLIVSKTVGNSVVRHRTSRRLRAQLATRLDRMPSGSALVVRAMPEAATSSSAELGAALDAALVAILKKREFESGPIGPTL